MEVKLKENHNLDENHIVIEVRAITEEIENLSHHIKTISNPAILKGRQDDKMSLVNVKNIYRVFIQNRKVMIGLVDSQLTVSKRLYQIEEKLSVDFVKISQSELINITHVRQFKLQKNGFMKVIMKNGDVTYSSRRYLNKIKERLGL